MVSIEFQLITKRQIPASLMKTFGRQTSRDFSMKMLTKYKQQWNAKDLKVGFSLKVIPQRLFHSTGTRYGLCLARNELLSQAEADHVIVLDDYTIISPLAVERLLDFLEPDLVVRGWKNKRKQQWNGSGQYKAFFDDHLKGKTPKPSTSKARKPKKVKQEGFIDPKLITGFDLFPMGMLRKVNGWDLKFDGSWGIDDYDLGCRLKHAGTWFRRVRGVNSFHLQHPSHTQEKGDESRGGHYIYNRETGARMDFNYLHHGGRGSYYRDHRDKGVFRAPVGLKEVAKLLGR